MKKRFLLLSISLLLFLSCFQSSSVTARGKDDQKKPFHIYLTWTGEDIHTSITVNYQTRKGTSPSLVYFGRKSEGGKKANYSNHAKGKARALKALARVVHHVQLRGLKPGQLYYFMAGSADGFSKEYKFRTVPKKGIHFVTGGDMGTGKRSIEMLKVAARQNPHFALIGGDLAYANGLIWKAKTWDRWLSNWETNMVTREGCLIPMILAIGNHEVMGGFGMSKDEAPFYFGYFSQGGKSYFHRLLGEKGLLVVLDSGHVNKHGDKQAKWLARTLKKYKNRPRKFAVYHVPLYPSHRSYWGRMSKAGRKHWAPLFDRYNLLAAFENHDHTFKRTKPLRGGKVTPGGTVYIGDGCWGRKPRTAYSHWYLEKSSSQVHIWLVEMGKKKVVFKALDRKGVVFDGFSSEGK